MTQCEMILEALQNGGSITNVEAVENYGIARLASRIHDLKRKGYKISCKWVEGKNRRGEKCRFKRFFIQDDK